VFSVAHRHTRAALPKTFAKGCGGLDGVTLLASAKSEDQHSPASDNGGAIPSNLLQIPNTESNSAYLRHCATVGAKPHPARFPEKLPTFFIEFLTDPGDTVLDIFAGSNTTGRAAERLDRRWIAFEKDRAYLAASAFRFVDELPAEELATLWSQLHSDALPVTVNRQLKELVLMEKPPVYAARRKRR
jgi:hypothetical protein